MRYIEEHYAKKLTVAQVAEHFGYTPNYLSKLLKRYLGLRSTSICMKSGSIGSAATCSIPRRGSWNFCRNTAAKTTIGVASV